MNPHQLTEKWHADRAGKITCSRLGAILGLDPYCAPKRYWEELVGLREPFAGNVATAWGQEHEPDARFDYECTHGVILTLRGFVTHPKWEWFGGSPDAIDEHNGWLVEFKCPYSQKIPTLPPPHYMAQAQGLLQVLGMTEGMIHYWTPGHSELFPVNRDDKWWEETALPALIDFYARVVRQEWPDEPRKRTSRHVRRAVQGEGTEVREQPAVHRPDQGGRNGIPDRGVGEREQADRREVFQHQG